MTEVHVCFYSVLQSGSLVLRDLEDAVQVGDVVVSFYFIERNEMPSTAYSLGVRCRIIEGEARIVEQQDPVYDKTLIFGLKPTGMRGGMTIRNLMASQQMNLADVTVYMEDVPIELHQYVRDAGGHMFIASTQLYVAEGVIKILEQNSC